jgi:(p)ppGpp synthase/HD superfamily hydrolase
MMRLLQGDPIMPQSARVYSARLYDAIGLAAQAHHRQVRKGTEVPYLVHPLAVAGILIRAGSPEHVVIAGVLHDTLEDTPVSVEAIRSQFGPLVTELVLAVSEPDRQAPWEARKSHTLDTLGSTPLPEALLVALADKLDNIRAIREGLHTDGAGFWTRFNRPKHQQEWYYRGLSAVFSRRVTRDPGAALAAEFSAEVARVFTGSPPAD